MSISDSLFVSLFSMVLVFLVLAVLAVLITLFSKVLGNFRNKVSKNSTKNSVKGKKTAAQAVPVLHASNDKNTNTTSVQ